MGGIEAVLTSKQSLIKSGLMYKFVTSLYRWIIFLVDIIQWQICYPDLNLMKSLILKSTNI